MRFPSRLLSAAAAMVLLSGAIVQPAATAASVRYTGLQDTVSAYVDEKTAAEVRSYFRNRVTEFSIMLPENLKVTKEEMPQLLQQLLYDAFEETGSGSEGDYLRFAVKNYNVASTGREVHFSMQYYTTAEQEKAVDKKASEILSKLALDGQTDYEKIRRIYDHITNSVTYSKDFTDPLVFSAYGAAVGSSAVCQGITQLMYKLLLESGVNARIIAGVSLKPGMSLAEAVASDDHNHVWMIVQADGRYYLCDPTWDINLGKGSSAFFMKGRRDFDENSVNTHVAYNSNGLVFPDYESDGFKAAYPVSDTAYKQVSYSWGDVDGNGFVDAVDASMILSEYARVSSGGQSTFSSSQKACADVRKDGIIDAVDASAVLAEYARLSVS